MVRHATFLRDSEHQAHLVDPLVKGNPVSRRLKKLTGAMRLLISTGTSNIPSGAGREGREANSVVGIFEMSTAGEKGVERQR